jgi:drug/metabolite transporter superfamily protein YnfA
MTPLLSLSLSILLSLLLSTVLVRVLSLPLTSVLSQICPSADAGRFWVAFTAVMLYIAPLFFAVFWESLVTDADLAQVVRQTLVSALFGAFAALLVVGYKIAGARQQPGGG